MKGLLIAGILSAAISSLDSILAALSQISVTMFYRPFVKPAERERCITSPSSRVLVIFGDYLSGDRLATLQSQGDLITLSRFR